jgi:hypothetical protein
VSGGRVDLFAVLVLVAVVVAVLLVAVSEPKGLARDLVVDVDYLDWVSLHTRGSCRRDALVSVNYRPVAPNDRKAPGILIPITPADDVRVDLKITVMLRVSFQFI